MIRNHLLELLSARGWSINSFAQQAGLTYPTAYNLCKGKTERYDGEVLERTCRVLGCQLGDILEYVKEGDITAPLGDAVAEILMQDEKLRANVAQAPDVALAIFDAIETSPAIRTFVSRVIVREHPDLFEDIIRQGREQASSEPVSAPTPRSLPARKAKAVGKSSKIRGRSGT